MSKVLVTESYLTDIGNAIRSKNGSTAQYKPSEMAAAINDIPSSGLDSVTILNSITLTGSYIDTGMAPSAYCLYTFSFDAQGKPSDYMALFGCRVSDGDSKCFGIIQVPNVEGILRLDFDTTDTSGSSTQINAGKTMAHSIYCFEGSGTTLQALGLSGCATYTKKAFPSYTTLTSSIYIGAYHRQDNNSAIFTNSSLKIYGFKVTYGDSLQASFIPAIYNGQQGLFETVNKRFHTTYGTITSL